MGPFALWNALENGSIDNVPCQKNNQNFNQFSHNEVAVKVIATYTDDQGFQWTFENQYWHMQTTSTGSKANGASIGTQYPTHPISGCKFYYAPGQPYHGDLASTGPHIHHQGKWADSWSSSPVKISWSFLGHQ